MIERWVRSLLYEKKDMKDQETIPTPPVTVHSTVSERIWDRPVIYERERPSLINVRVKMKPFIIHQPDLQGQVVFEGKTMKPAPIYKDIQACHRIDFILQECRFGHYFETKKFDINKEQGEVLGSKKFAYTNHSIKHIIEISNEGRRVTKDPDIGAAVAVYPYGALKPLKKGAMGDMGYFVLSSRDNQTYIDVRPESELIQRGWGSFVYPARHFEYMPMAGAEHEDYASLKQWINKGCFKLSVFDRTEKNNPPIKYTYVSNAYHVIKHRKNELWISFILPSREDINESECD